MYLHLLLQHSEAVTEASHCSLGSLAPFPQREVWVLDWVPVEEEVAVSVDEPVWVPV